MSASQSEEPVQVLVLEDDPLDAELIESTLQLGGIASKVDWVENREGFESALERGSYDLVLSDHALPSFDGLSALELARARAPQLPFIIVSGTIGEEPAVDAVLHGVTDYVLKHRLERLVPSVRRALREAQERKHRERAEQALLATERRYRVLYDENPSMHFTVAQDLSLRSVNRYGAEQLGYTPDELVGRAATALHLSEELTAAEQHYRDCFREPEVTHRWEIRKRRRDGRSIWVRETARVVTESDGTPAVLSVCEDTSEARELSRELEYQATHDALTGLVNRAEFERRLRRALSRARETGVEHALCYIDLDQFKIINDTSGHGAGDELLRQLGPVMAEHVRHDDTLARLGGDEFGVLLEHCSIEQGRRAAEALSRAIADVRFSWEGRVFTVGASIGLVSILESTSDVSEVLAAADSACYSAKENGRNRIHVYEHGDEELTRRRGEMQWVTRVNEAISNDRLRLARQPIVALQRPPGGGESFEMLLRLLDEDDAIVPPGAFLPAVERYGLSVRVDSWVVEQTFRWLRESYGDLDGIESCAINLSGQSLGDDGFLDFVVDCLDRSGIPGGKICFEITETAAISNVVRARRAMEVLRARSVRFALDDFGSGLSSFAYLKSLPIDVVKIDGMFVRDICDDPVDRQMVKAITEVGRTMGKEIVAEFVESEAVLEEIRALGVDFAQGYLLGRPELIELPRP